MKKTEQDARRWGLVGAVVFLLLGFVGCVKTLERGAEPVVPGSEALVSSVTAADASAVPPTDPQGAVATAQTMAPVEDTLRVHEILLTEVEGERAVVIHLSRPPDDLRHFALPEPDRIIVDLVGPLAPDGQPRTHAASDPGVAAVRVATHDGKLRIVADLREPVADYGLEEGERTVAILLGPSVDPVAPQILYVAAGVEDDLGTDLPVSDVAPAFAVPADPASAWDVAEAAEPASPEHEALAATVAPETADPAPSGETVTDDEVTDAAAVAETPLPAEVAAAEVPAPTEVADAAGVPAEVTEVTADAAAPEPELAPGADGAEAAPHPEAIAPPPPPVAVAALDESPASEMPHRSAAAALDETPQRAPSEARPAPAARAPEAPPRFLEEDEAYEPPAFERPKTYALPVLANRGPGGAAAPRFNADPDDEREYTGQRISLDFKDADIQNVLRILADVSGLNIITTEDVQGRLTMRLIDVPWDQALEAILKAKGLDMVRDGNIVRVSTVEQLKKEREAQRAADEAQKQVEPLRVRYVRVNYAKADENLVKKVREVLTERGSVTWDERTNTIVVRDIARGIADAEELITQFDTQTPQVLIEANIVEATEALIRDLGIQWGYTYRASPETGNAPGVNFPGRIGAGGVLAGGENSPAGRLPFIADFPAAVAPGSGAAYDLFLGSLDNSSTLNARLTALERQGKGRIISRPRVVTLNNVPAKIASLEILRVRLPSTGTVISTGAGGVAGSAQTATERIETGIVLQVTPQVSSDGFIFLDVYAKSSTASRERSTDNIPNEVSREANSHVLIKDGETFVLGGVFRNEFNQIDRGVPFLSSIPVLGWLFKNNLKDDSRQELLVFVTPRTTRARGTESLASLPSAESLWQNRVHP